MNYTELEDPFPPENDTIKYIENSDINNNDKKEEIIVVTDFNYISNNDSLNNEYNEQTTKGYQNMSSGGNILLMHQFAILLFLSLIF